MAWAIEYTATARKQLEKLDRQVARRIVDYLTKRVATRSDPRELANNLSGPLGDLWRYRVGDFRIVVEIQDTMLTVLVVRIGHRRSVYR